MPNAPAIPPATVSYKWPSKVLRYKITCPFQRMLVVKHEAQIDWDGHIHGTRIESVQALDAHIKDVMLPALHRWMDPADEKSHCCRQIDLEKMLANPDLKARWPTTYLHMRGAPLKYAVFPASEKTYANATARTNASSAFTAMRHATNPSLSKSILSPSP